MNSVLLGAVAGAAGTMALDVTTYSDMAMRGRGSSNTPAEVVRRMADKAGMEPLNKPDAEADEQTKNRRSALGALSGYLIGLTIGATYGAANGLFSKVPVGAKALVLGGLAMAASDVPATMLDATDPKQWGTGGWMSDIVPHVIYGLVTVAVFDAIMSGI
jgi:hypothetical protein